MKKVLTLKEIQEEEQKILQETVNYLNKNNINYSLCGGTLLGAIRHKGFIPWDDDIDIFIPRPDYEKLICIAKENKNITNNIVLTGTRLKNGIYPMLKAINKNIKTESINISKKYNFNLWVDIFPIDGMEYEESKIAKKIKTYISIYFLKVCTYKKIINANRKTITKILKMICKSLLTLIPTEMISYQIDKLARLNKYDKTEYVGNYIFGYGKKERMKKEIFETYTDVEFEGTKYKGLKEYDKYLTNLYGDYMKLPPKEKRVTHSFKAWRVEDEEIKK